MVNESVFYTGLFIKHRYNILRQVHQTTLYIVLCHTVIRTSSLLEILQKCKCQEIFQTYTNLNIELVVKDVEEIWICPDCNFLRGFKFIS